MDSQLEARESARLRQAIRRAGLFLSRRRAVLGMVLGSLVLVDLVTAYAWPSTYRATATIAVEPARLPDDVKSLVPSIQERIGRLAGIALSDSALLADAAGAPALAQPHWVREAFDPSVVAPVQRLRERISVEVRPPDRPQLISVSVTGESRAEVAAVASQVAARFVMLDRQFRFEIATAIHHDVIADAAVDRKPLAEIERRIEELRTQNPLMATTADAAIRTQAAELESRALEDDVAQAELQANLPLLESEAARWGAAVNEQAELARRLARETEQAKTVKREPTTDDPRRARIVALERELVQARSRWTEQNPDVRRLLREIALERERIGESEGEPGDGGGWSGDGAGSGSSPGSGPGAGPPSGAGETPPPPEKKPASEAPSVAPPSPPGVGRRPRDPGDEVRAVADTSGSARADVRFVIEAPAYPAWREAVAKLEAGRSRLDALKLRNVRRSEELKRLRALVEKLPEKRLELSRLEAERDRLSARMGEARQRIDRVRRSFRIETEEGTDGAQPERLALAEAAQVPDAPLGPDRPWLFLLGLLIAIPVALTIAYVREVQDRSLHSGAEVMAALDLPVLGVIPRLRGRR
jgi:hypothetical protein